MGKPTATAVAPSRFGAFEFTSELAEDLINQAVETGGRLSAEDRISGGGNSLPIYSVVAKSSEDAAVYSKEHDCDISRVGQFRLHEGGEIAPDGYRKSIFPVVILDARSQYAAWLNDKVVARAISTRGLYDPIITDPPQLAGMNAEDSALWRFREGERNHPLTGQPMDTKKEVFKSSLELYCWDPQADPEGTKLFRISFTGMAFKKWRKWAGGLENKGVKLWSLWFAVRSECLPGKPGESDSYIPDFAAGPASQQLNAAEVAKATELRDALLVSLAPSASIPVRAIVAPAAQAALPSPAIEADDDIFADN